MKIKNFIRTWITRIVFPDLYNWVLNVNQLSKEVREYKDLSEEFITQGDLEQVIHTLQVEDEDLSDKFYELNADVEQIQYKLNDIDNLVDYSETIDGKLDDLMNRFDNMQEAIQFIANKLNISKEIAEILNK